MFLFPDTLWISFLFSWNFFREIISTFYHLPNVLIAGSDLWMVNATIKLENLIGLKNVMTMRNNILIGLPRLVAVALTCQLPDWLNSLVTAGLAVVISLPSENLNTYTRSFRLQRRPVNNNSFYICTGWSLFVHLYLLYLNVILTLALIWHLTTK